MQVAERRESSGTSAPTHGRGRLSGYWMFAVILAITILFNWKLALTNQYVWLEFPDGIDQVLPWLQFQALQWHGFHIPAWDPNAWSGQPLFGQTQPGSAWPLNWLLFLTPMTNGHIDLNIINRYAVLTRFIAALAGYALCRDLRCSRIASLLGAFVVAGGGFVADTGWPQMLNGAILMPLVFLFLFRTAKGVHPFASSILSGFFLGLSWLAGHHQVPTYATVSVIGVWAWLCFRDGNFKPEMLKFAVMSLVMTGVTGALQLLPTAEYGRLSIRWVGGPEPLGLNDTVPYYLHERLAHGPLSFLGVILPNIVPAWKPFVGIVAVCLAVLAVFLAWRETHVRCLTLLATCSLLFTIGPASLLHGVLYAVMPLIDKTRSPGAANAVFGASIAPLAAIGLERLLRERPNVLSKQTAWVLTGFGVLILSVAAVFGMVDAKGAAGDQRLVVSGFVALTFAVILLAHRNGALRASGTGFSIFALLLFELALVTNQWLPQRGPNNEKVPLTNNLEKHLDIVQFLATRADHGRVEYKFDDIPYNFGDYFNIPTFTSYTASVTNNIWAHNIFSRHGRDFFGIRYSIGKTVESPEQREVFSSTSGLKVFENPNALPRVWAAHQSVTVSDMPAARRWVEDPRNDPQKTVALVGNDTVRVTDCAEAKDDKVNLAVAAPNRMIINANLGCAGMVILDDTWFPGWRATVDGKPTQIHEAYGVFRGVMVPAGPHKVDMRYRPTSVIAGGILTLLATIFAVLTWMRSSFSRSDALPTMQN